MPDSPESRSFPPADGTLDRALGVVRFLRAQCPWDAEQTPTSLIPHLLEESREVVAAIHDRDEESLQDELGDLLLNLAFQVVLAEERGAFDAEAVAGGLEAKMVRRHPHLFGDGPPVPWRELKARERAARAARGRDENLLAPPSALSPIAAEADPLVAAFRLQDEAAAVGFDWDDALGALEKLKEEMEEVREAMDAADASAATAAAGPAPADDAREALAEELGDVLFAFVNVARKLGIHPQVVLGEANRKFYRRFQAVEAAARLQGLPMPGTPLDALDALWDEAKVAEKKARAQAKRRQ